MMTEPSNPVVGTTDGYAKEVRLFEIQARLDDWDNPPNAVSVKLTARGRKGRITHVSAMFAHAVDDLHFLLREIASLRHANDRIRGKLVQVQQALYDHAGEIKVGERESRDALAVRALRAQRDILMNAVRVECNKFAFPDEDRPELNDALSQADVIRWDSLTGGFEVPDIPRSEEEFDLREQEARIESALLTKRRVELPDILSTDLTPGLAAYTASKQLDVLPDTPRSEDEFERSLEQEENAQSYDIMAADLDLLLKVLEPGKP